MEADSESENSNPLNEIERQLINDLQEQWKEPASRGDLRNHAVRMDSRFGKIDVRFDKMDARFEGIDARFDKVDAHFDKVDAKFDALNARFDTFKAEIITLINTSGLRYIGAMITTNIAMFAIFERFFAS